MTRLSDRGVESDVRGTGAGSPPWGGIIIVAIVGPLVGEGPLARCIWCGSNQG